MLCRHCQKVRSNRPRGLCWSCYYTPGVRDLYPSTSKFARRGVSDFCGKARLPEQVFLKAAVMVLEDDIARASQDRRNQPRVAPLRETETATPNGRQA